MRFWMLSLLLFCDLSAAFRPEMIPDEKYILFGKELKHFAPVGIVQSRLGTSTGTLISPYVVLTAAHCVEDGEGASFEIALSGHVRFCRVNGLGIRHPDFKLEDSKNQGIFCLKNDLAVIILEKPIYGVPPAEIDFLGFYNAMQSYTSTGYGRGGTIKGEEKSIVRKKRGFTNKVVSSPFALEGVEFFSMWDSFTPLEGLAAPGDSGAPVFVTVDDREVVVGIHCLLVYKDKIPFCNGILSLEHYEEWINEMLSLR